MALGQGDYRYEVVDRWAKLPEGWAFSLVSDAAIDSRGRIYAFTRGRHPVIVFDKEGRFITSWGYGEFGLSPNLISQPHGIFIGPEDEVYLTDAYQHVVRRCSRLGAQLIDRHCFFSRFYGSHGRASRRPCGSRRNFRQFL